MSESKPSGMYKLIILTFSKESSEIVAVVLLWSEFSESDDSVCDETSEVLLSELPEQAHNTDADIASARHNAIIFS